MRYPSKAHKFARRFVKRLFDIIFSAIMLIVLMPVFLVIILAVRLTSKGNAIYGHTRVGRGGKPFKCYKFRTMYADADARLQQILETDPLKKEEWEQSFKLKDDPRVTPIGNFLRKTSLDELPQFWNVLVGELSVVGPRPVVAKEVSTYFGEKANKILSVRPGVTGLWQVSGRSDVSYSHRIKMDEQYIDNLSIRHDIKLIFLTIPCMIMRKGAY